MKKNKKHFVTTTVVAGILNNIMRIFSQMIVSNRAWKFVPNYAFFFYYYKLCVLVFPRNTIIQFYSNNLLNCVIYFKSFVIFE